MDELKDAVAIVGVACRFPSASSYQAFWQLIAHKKDAVKKIPDRRHLILENLQTPLFAGLLDEVAAFDANFFGISPKEALSMDPQQRLLLEVFWEACEDSGLTKEALAGSKAGVFVGISTYDYAQIQARMGAALDAYMSTGNALSVAANRISYLFDLQGPSMAIDTACSSSLVATHLACQSLLRGESDHAFVGGVNLLLSPDLMAAFKMAGMLSPSGRCQTFDAKADGYVRGEGCGVVVLKRYADAQRDHDRIFALIMGSAINQDGHSNGLTAPNGLAQQAVIRTALKNANLSAEQLQYIEAHGTGTPLGDPIEVEALQSVMGKRHQSPCAVGSVKTNIGHLEAAAGIAGLIKTALALRYKKIPPSLHFNITNPNINLDEQVIYFPTALQAWHQGKMPRVAGVSSFGFGGSNAHVILQEAPIRKTEQDKQVHKQQVQIFCLSAASEQALLAQARRYSDHLSAQSSFEHNDLVRLCTTSTLRRSHFTYRAAIPCENKATLLAGLQDLAEAKEVVRYVTAKQTKRSLAMVWVFSGQGGQYVNMGRELYHTQPVFRQALDSCDVILQRYQSPSICQAYGTDSAPPEALYANSQAWLVAIQIALYELWLHWGIKPKAVLGHSLGEIPAAYAAGILNLEDALHLASLRQAVMQYAYGSGGMLLCHAPQATIAECLLKYQALDIAVINDVYSCVVSGPVPALNVFKEDLAGRKIQTQMIKTVCAFHSAEMEQAQHDVRHKLNWLKPKPSKIPFYSSLTGARQAGDTLDAAYWAQQIRSPVQFAKAMQAVIQQRYPFYLEIAPHPILQQAIINNCEAQKMGAQVFYSLRRNKAEYRELLLNLAKCHCHGLSVNWSAFYKGDAWLSLPTYAWQRRRFWFDGQKGPSIKGSLLEKPPASDNHRSAILQQCRDDIAMILGDESKHIDADKPLLEMGADSIALASVVRNIQRRYGLTISMRQFFTELTNLNILVDFIAQHYKPVNTKDSKLLSNEDIEQLLERQLQAFKTIMREQLHSLGYSEKPKASSDITKPTPVMQAKVERFGPYRRLKQENLNLNQQQNSFLTKFMTDYVKKTAGSKHRAAAWRPQLADSRASAGFRPSLKEMLYPIVGEKADGAYVWDIDGNRYLDISMDFGANLFGHGAQFIQVAQQKQIQQSMALALKPALAGEVAKLICELTHMRRVVFCQTGTEAVMTAIRIARTVTERDKIVIFHNSYHGHSDGVLAIAAGDHSEPVTLGIPQAAVLQVMVLDYGQESALQTIKEQGHDIAAVLVEPVQARNPSLQPTEFLQQLRQLTKQLGCQLIFDEMITGFRSHPGGAQAIFAIEADLVTYGKVLGGGVPLAAVACRDQQLAAIDGGLWAYGDDSYPEADTTFFAGTYHCYPLAMASAFAVLSELKKRGPLLQETLTAKTKQLADTLNAWFVKEQVPLKIVYFASLFRFQYQGNLDILFYLLLYEGLFIWEGRNCFLSAAHSAADIDNIIKTVKKAVLSLRSAGLLQSRGLPVVAQESRATFSLPLSDAQKQLWGLTQLNDLASVAYNECLALTLEGELKRGYLEQALQAVVMRHEALRTTMDAFGETQIIHQQLTADWQVLDCNDEYQSTLTTICNQPFNLQTGPLIRAALLVQNATQSIFVLVAHHIIIDGWSLGVILHDIIHYYNACCENKAVKLSPVKQFRDFLAWQNNELAKEAMQAHRAYWRQSLQKIPTLALLANQAGSSLKFQGARESFSIGRTLKASIDRFNQQAGKTLFMTLLAAYLSFLHRWLSEEHLLIACNVTGRHMKGSEELVGYLTHLLPIVSHMDRTLTFREFLANMVNTLFEVYEHQDCPFAEILKEIDYSKKNLADQPIKLIFNLDPPVEFPEFYGLNKRVLDTPSQPAKIPLGLNAREMGDDMRFEFSFNTTIFSVDLMQTIKAQFKRWLGAVVSAPDTLLGQIPLDPTPEKSLHTTLALLFERCVANLPTATAILNDDEAITYQDFNACANRLAHYLRAEGIGRQHLVGLCALPSLNTLIGLFAILKAGAAYVPIDPAYHKKRIQHIIKDAQIRLVLSEKSMYEQLPESIERISLDRLTSDYVHYSCENPLPINSAEDLAYVIYTSGSTGLPKGVMVTHANVHYYIEGASGYAGVADCEFFDCSSSLAFDFSVSTTLLPLLLGKSVVLAQNNIKKDAASYAQYIARHKIDFVKLTPSYLKVLVEIVKQQPALLTALRVMLLGGEELHSLPVKSLLHYYPKLIIINEYGPTETTVGVTHCVVNAAGLAESDKIPIGRATDQRTQLYVVDAALKPVGKNAKGELLIAGACVSQGYWQKPQLTTNHFVLGAIHAGEICYRTGDQVSLRDDGQLDYWGREDRQVKRRGYRVELDEIETVLNHHPMVAQAAVLLKASAQHENIMAYVVLTAPQTVAEIKHQLRTYLQQQLADFMQPTAFILLDKMPLTTHEKIDYAALRCLPEEKHAKNIRPKSALEKKFVTVWSKVLGLETVGLEDNFFNLGGDSIQSIQVITRLRAMGLNISPQQLFDHPTIAACVKLVNASQEQVKPVMAHGTFALSPIQQCFFAQAFTQNNYFNQAILLKAQQPMDRVMLTACFKKLIEQHDSLRLRFRYRAGQWNQYYADESDIYQLSIQDISIAAHDEFAICSELQAKLNMTNGPIMQVAILNGYQDHCQRLFIAVHHLMIDVVSWHILLDDLTACYQAFAKGQTLLLANKTASYQDWVSRLQQYAKEHKAQLSYWKNLGNPHGFLPNHMSTVSAKPACNQCQRIVCSRELTQGLQIKASGHYRVKFNEILLSALLLAYQHIFNQEDLWLFIENHGRTQLGDCDISQTIGWFTNLFPVRLHLNTKHTNVSGQIIKSVKEQLRRIPDHGLGYGALRYLSQDRAISKAFQLFDKIDVGFNYLGKLDAGGSDDDWLVMEPRAPGAMSASDNARFFPLEIEGFIRDDILVTEFYFSDRDFMPDIIAKFTAAYHKALQTLLLQSQKTSQHEYTPADFTTVSLSTSELAALLAEDESQELMADDSKHQVEEF